MKIYNQNIWGNFSEDQCVANRNSLIRELIDECNPDVCCMQECNPNTSRVGDFPMQEILKPDFVEVVPEFAHENFTPIFYNKETTQLVEGGYMPYEGFNDVNSKSITWAVLKDKATSKLYIVASTHFWYMARGKIDEEQRMANAEAAVGILKKLYEKYNVPAFLTGDLNSSSIVTNQGMGGYNKVVELGMTDVREIAKKTDYSHTCSKIMPVLDNGIYSKGGEPDFTLDFMFVMGKDMINAKEYSVINSDKARTSSDHSPVVFEFDI